MSSSRVAGVTIPLFSIRTAGDWGIGQIGDMPACAAWIERAGHRLLQILPPYELALGETSPYGARTAFGLDPIYVTLEHVPDLDAAAIDEALGDEGRRERDRLRALPRVDYARVRALKARVFERAFDRFYAREWVNQTPRAKELEAFIHAQEAWLVDLALYVALRESHQHHAWSLWPDEEKHRDPATLGQARQSHARRILEYQYAQWILHTQWLRARAEISAMGAELMGDLPFIVGSESADVWAHNGQFRRDVSLGAPPDAFSEDGQDWGLPAYDWTAMERDDLAWLRARTRHASTLYDRFRLDHVVGYFRQYVKAPGQRRGAFDPEGEDAQRARGERVLGVVEKEAGSSRVIGEDLGVIPPFVREELAGLRIPGYRVLPWENDDGRYRDPARFPETSVATWSTHDTPPITAWWDELPRSNREELGRLAGVSPDEGADTRWLPLLRLLLGSSSELTLVLSAEVLGEKARINTPATVGSENWSYRLPKSIEELERDGEVNRRMDALRTLARDAGRA